MSHLREALELAQQGHADYEALSNNLGAMLLTRFVESKTQSDLEGAVKIGHDVIDKTPKNHPDRSTRLSNLSHIIFTRYVAMDKLKKEDLEEAIGLAKKAAGVLSKEKYSEKANLWGYIGMLFWEKYLLKAQGANKDLNEAIKYTSKVINGANVNFTLSDIHSKLGWLGTMFLERYDLAGANNDLEDAIGHMRDAIEATVWSGGKGYLVSDADAGVNGLNRSSLLRGTVVLLQGSPVGKEATSEDYIAYYTGLATMLFRRFEKDKSEEDLDEVIALVNKVARATPDQHPQLSLLVQRMRSHELNSQKQGLDEIGAITDRLDEVLKLRPSEE
ncbi:hypothetical protein F5Y14DRAFT_432861 [Nemania sp. NC0429]|nr:hypothetical protein F5Y14DRAFT_432861 [Nemania sp. NC0429]